MGPKPSKESEEANLDFEDISEHTEKATSLP